MQSLVLNKLHALCLANTMPHAWLLVDTDPQKLEKTAQELSQWLLCLQNSAANSACGKCKACTLFGAHTHPDFLQITPAADKSAIAVADIRHITEFVASKPQFSLRKVVLITPAHAMLPAAANALLKCLEEPPSDTIFLLLARHSELLLKTIVSRCQVLQLGVQQQPATASVHIPQQITSDLYKVWVSKSMTPVQIVESWNKQWPHEVLYWLEVVLADVLRFRYTQDPSLARFWSAEQASISKACTASKFWHILMCLRQAQSAVAQKQNPNLQLLLEDMLLI